MPYNQRFETINPISNMIRSFIMARSVHFTYLEHQVLSETHISKLTFKAWSCCAFLRFASNE